MVLLLICFSCYSRTSSEDRFETNIDFALPFDKNVIKDDFQDMLQDFVLFYMVELSPTSNLELINQIKPLVVDNEKKCNWSLIENGFKYQCEKGQIFYQVNYDTLKRTVTYQEFAD